MRPMLAAAMLALSLSGSAQASDTVAVIESVVPALPAGVKVDIAGADSPLRVKSQGHAVEVRGYEDEPYLRIDADGSAWINDASVSAALNEDRYGSDAGPRLPSTEPSWRRTRPDGTVMWHDHRVHWMSRTDPPVLDDEGRVLVFAVPIVVDGTVHTVAGTLYLRPEASAAWWAGALCAFAVALAVRRRETVTVIVSVGIAAVGVLVGASQWFSLPSGARIAPLLVGFSALALVILAVGTLPVVRRLPGIGAATAAGTGASLAVGAVLCSEQVRAAWVPGTDVQARVLVPMMLGWGAFLVVDAVLEIARPQRSPNV